MSVQYIGYSKNNEIKNGHVQIKLTYKRGSTLMTKINQNETNENQEVKYIKDYIIDYKNHKDKQRLINDLIYYPVVEQIIQEGNKHDIRHLKFYDKLMNSWITEIKKEYLRIVSREDIEDAVTDFLATNNVFDNTDTSKSVNEVAFYVRKAFFGHIKTYFKNELHFDENTIMEDMTNPLEKDGSDFSDDDRAYSLYECADYSNWIEVEYSTSYSKFIEAIGGLENVLTKNQLEVVTMSNIMSQREVAKRVGVSEANVSKTLTQADKRLKKSYLSWRTAEIMNDSSEIDTTKTVKTFLEQFDKIAEVDTGNTFDYFAYIVNFIKDNSTKRDFDYNYKFMQSNKIDVSLSVVDLISDYIIKSQYELVTDVLDAHVRGLDQDKTFTKRQRERFSKAIVGAFYKYLEEIEGNINEFLDVAVDNFAVRNNEKLNQNKTNDYDELIGLIGYFNNIMVKVS